MSLPKDYDKKIYFLPRSLRLAFRKAYGETYLDVNEIREELKNSFVVSVGDVVSFNLIKSGIKPNVIVFDEKCKREATDFDIKKTLVDYEARLMIVKNPASHITPQLWKAVKDALKSEEPVKIFVEGEEDLAVLPFVLEAEEGTLILYGLEGFVVAIRVDQEIKKVCEDLLKRMKVKKFK